MRRVIIDTNVYTGFKKNNTAVVEAFHHFDFIGINITVLAELYSGFKGGIKEDQKRKELEEFINNTRVAIIALDEDTAEFYSEIYFKLRQKATPIPTNDIWIAASAMQHGLALYTLDRHFEKIDGLIIKS